MTFKSHAMRVTTSSKTHTWRTPLAFIALVRQLDQVIGLDPSANHKRKNQFATLNLTGPRGPAQRTYRFDRTSMRADGLAATWRGHGLVYCNPPYGRQMHLWITKACRAFRKARFQDTDDELVMLIPARPDTRWFHDLLTHADALCFWKGRLKFVRGQSLAPAPFPSLVVYFGRRPKRFRKIFGPHGWVTIINK